ncbi:MAG TPA: chloride channel protein [Alphaproteobacteria bacterium]|nr:chloride channel protein [Alphaproteobacteria bacterium]
MTPPSAEAIHKHNARRSWLSRLRPEQAGTGELRDFTTDLRVIILIGMAALIGAVGAYVAYALQWLIGVITNFAYFGRFGTHMVSPAGTPLGVWSVAIPVIGSLIVGFMARYGSEKIRGHGIPEAIEAILIGGSRLEPKVAVLKPLSSAIAIGTGGPFGAEGPIIMTGGAFGSLFAQLFHLSAAERKTLLVAGAAAGMSATFNTPVAAVLLAVELLLFEWKPRSFLPVATASAVAAVFRPMLLGSGALFPLHTAVVLPWWGLVICALVGISAGLVSGGLTALVYGFEDLFRHLPIHWMWWPALGGLAIGIGGLIAPRALGVGYDIIGDLLHNNLTIGVIVGIVLVKAFIWSIALGSGTSGGVLAPLLIMGGALGALEGHIIPVGDPGFWALLGMSAIMGGTMRSPLTGIMFALELTRDLGALLPLLIACSAAFALTVLLLKRSILTEKVARRGHHIMREYIVDPFEMMLVEDVMVRDVNSLKGSMPVDEAVRFFSTPTSNGDEPKRHKSYPVVDAQGRVLGMVARADALRWTMTGWTQGATLADMVSEQTVLKSYPDELVGRLADRMAIGDHGRVPVVDRSDGRLVGIVARKDLLRVRARMLALETDRNSVIGIRRRNGAAKHGHSRAEAAQ